jgi:hypothetical protein
MQLQLKESKTLAMKCDSATLVRGGGLEPETLEQLPLMVGRRISHKYLLSFVRLMNKKN